MSSMVILALILTLPSGFIIGMILRSQRAIGSTTLQLCISSLIAAAVTSLLVIGINYGSVRMKTTDVEILSGHVTDKTRKHDHYKKRHETCTTVNERRKCRVWYEDRYTVEWDIHTTLGKINVQSLDRGSRSVYATPNPQVYADAVVGEPAAKEHTYTNYLKGIPKEFLYTEHMASTPEALAKVPAYPSIYSLYKINRVMDLDNVLPAGLAEQFNLAISNELKTLGPSKEVNILLLAGHWDDTFQYAIRERWDGGKKNDVIVYIGVEDGKIVEARVQTWGDNELFSLRLQDVLVEHGIVDDTMLTSIFEQIQHSYKRPQMKDYEYLRVHIQPSNMAIVLMFTLVFLSPFGVMLFIKFNSKPRFR